MVKLKIYPIYYFSKTIHTLGLSSRTKIFKGTYSPIPLNGIVTTAFTI